MRKYYLTILIFFFLQNNLIASVKNNILEKFEKIENISFNFIQTINGKDEKGICTIKYPKKIFCEYEKRNNKILVSNGTSLVIKNNKQYYRYPIKSTPFQFLLDKDFLIDKIISSKLLEIDERFIFIRIDESNNKIDVFFSKKDYGIVGWQVEDVYQNLAVTFIFNSSINNKINEKIFKLPAND